MQVLQVLFLQDLALNLASLVKSCKKITLQFFLASSCKIFEFLQEKASFLVQDLQDLVQDLATKILTRLAFFLQDGFYWDGS